MTKTLDAGMAVARFLEPLQNVVGERAHMAVRSAASHDHLIGDRGLTLKVDRDDFFGFVFVEGLEDELEETLAVLPAAPLTCQSSFSLSDASEQQAFRLALAATGDPEKL